MNQRHLIEITREHFRSVIDKNLSSILNAYSKSENLLVFVEGPRWMTVGYQAVAKGWRDFCSSSINLRSCDWIDEPEAECNDLLGFVAGMVKLEVEINGETKHTQFRGSFVFKNEGDRWRIIHEHFSQPAADPYGIGDWIKP